MQQELNNVGYNVMSENKAKVIRQSLIDYGRTI